MPEGGERFEGLLSPVVAEPVFSIRRPASLPLALADYVAAGTMSADAATLILPRLNLDNETYQI